jgi:hypothetical protein
MGQIVPLIDMELVLRDGHNGQQVQQTIHQYT